MERKHKDIDSIKNAYNQSQIAFDNLNAREFSEQELMYHLRQIHRLLFMMNEKLEDKNVNNKSK